jgi:hypothetical protein
MLGLCSVSSTQQHSGYRIQHKNQLQPRASPKHAEPVQRWQRKTAEQMQHLAHLSTRISYSGTPHLNTLSLCNAGSTDKHAHDVPSIALL